MHAGAVILFFLFAFMLAVHGEFRCLEQLAVSGEQVRLTGFSGHIWKHLIVTVALWLFLISIQYIIRE